MTVFKGYLSVTKKNIGTLIMYFAIFLGIAVLTASLNSDDDYTSFANKKLNICVADSDKSELSGLLIDYLEKIHEVEIVKNNPSQMQEELYYGKRHMALRIDKGFGENAGEKKDYIRMTQAPGSYYGAYVEQQINRYLGDVLQYQSLGYTLEESADKVVNQKKAKVELEDLSGQGGKDTAYLGFYRYYPYLFMAALATVLATVILSFRKKNIKNRMLASSYSLARQNAESIFAMSFVGIALYAITNLTAVILYGKDLYQSSNFAYFLLNSFVNMLICFALGFIVGLLSKKLFTVSMMITPISLGLSFISGVFVPLEMLGENVKNVARCLPIYWYEYVQELLGKHAVLEGEVLTNVWKGIGIQGLYFVALIGIVLVITKIKQQENK